MAAVHVVSVRLIDDGGKSSTVVVYLPATASIANVQTFVDSYLPHLDLVTGARIDNVTVSLGLSLPGGLKQAALADHPVNYGANLAFDVALTPYRWTQHVPSIRQTLVNGDAVDTTAQVVIDVLNDMADGVGGIVPTNPFGLDLVTAIDAYVSFRKS